MQLIMFDLDGTLVDSSAIDSECYLQALVDVFCFDLDGINQDWASYPHITDAGILYSLCETELGRDPTPTEVRQYQTRFLDLLDVAVSNRPLQSIAGAREILHHLTADPDYAIALATGAWGTTARFKLEVTGLDELISTTACADDAHARVEIMQCAYQRSILAYQQPQFESITYIGDGVWDGIAANHLDYNFIGIGTGDRATALLATGAKSVFPHYQDLAAIMSVLNL
jgi:phosphoglycolate phosphatase-like HAD superfamily hydrolase